jgi:hypothetical protein
MIGLDTLFLSLYARVNSPARVSRSCLGSTTYYLTERRYLPLARRALITLRPFLLAIRFKNPLPFLAFAVEPRKVLFIAANSCAGHTLKFVGLTVNKPLCYHLPQRHSASSDKELSKNFTKKPKSPGFTSGSRVVFAL